MSTRRVCLCTIAIAMLVAGPALAEQGDSKIRFGLEWVSPTGDYTESDGFEEIELEAAAAAGPFFQYEFMITDRTGIFGHLGYLTHDVDAELRELSPGGLDISDTIGEVDVIPFEVGVNFYVVQNDAVDFYLGPKIAYVMFGDVELESQFVDPGDPTDVPTDDSFGFGANAGIDVKIGSSGWMFCGGLQYLVFSLETDEGVDSVDVDIDPFVVRAGFGKRF